MRRELDLTTGKIIESEIEPEVLAAAQARQAEKDAAAAAKPKQASAESLKAALIKKGVLTEGDIGTGEVDPA